MPTPRRQVILGQKPDMNPLPVGAGKNDKQIKNISCGTGCQVTISPLLKARTLARSVPNILFISGGPGQITKRVLKRDRFLKVSGGCSPMFSTFDIRVRAGFSEIDDAE